MQESGSIDFAAENFKLIELTHRQVCQQGVYDITAVMMAVCQQYVNSG